MRFILPALLATVISAQSFEVASVKRSAQENGSGARSTGAVPRQQEPGRINFPAVKLKGVIALAWGVDQDQVTGPQWLDDERYDIAATLPANASRAALPAMLQHLLVERFHMAVHEETKPQAGYALVAGKGTAKLKPSKESGSLSFEVRSDSIQFTNMTMEQFAKFLSQSGRPVTDQTGIAGHYDFTVNISMADIKAGLTSGPVADLGLKLETRRAPAKFVVVDKADKVPTEN